MKVSWKQSSASPCPTDATRKRQTASRCASRKRWKGGGAMPMSAKRAPPPRREIAGSAPWAVVEEARSARAPGAAGAHHALDHRGRAVALLSVLVAERLEHRQDVVEADRVGPRERSAGMVQAEHHPGVDVVKVAHAFAERERALVDHLADDPSEHQA